MIIAASCAASVVPALGDLLLRHQVTILSDADVAALAFPGRGGHSTKDSVSLRLPAIGTALRAQQRISEWTGAPCHSLAAALKLVHGKISRKLYNKFNKLNKAQCMMKHVIDHDFDSLLADLSVELAATPAAEAPQDERPAPLLLEPLLFPSDPGDAVGPIIDLLPHVTLEYDIFQTDADTPEPFDARGALHEHKYDYERKTNGHEHHVHPDPQHPDYAADIARLDARINELNGLLHGGLKELGAEMVSQLHGNLARNHAALVAGVQEQCDGLGSALWEKTEELLDKMETKLAQAFVSKTDLRTRERMHLTHTPVEHGPADSKCERQNNEYKPEHQNSEYEHQNGSEHEHQSSKHETKNKGGDAYEHRNNEYEHQNNDYEWGDEHQNNDYEYEHQTDACEHRNNEYEHRNNEYEHQNNEYAHRNKEYEHQNNEYEHQNSDEHLGLLRARDWGSRSVRLLRRSDLLALRPCATSVCIAVDAVLQADVSIKQREHDAKQFQSCMSSPLTTFTPELPHCGTA